MAKTKEEPRLSPDIPEITEALRDYRLSHPRARVRSYRQNSACLRVRIIDPDFRGMDRAERHELIWKILEPLSEEILSEISILLLLTPEETKTSIANIDFENPIPSRL